MLVSGVLKGSPAEKAGIKAGDIIIQVGASKVKVETIEDMPYFNQLISELPLNRYTRIIFLREGKQKAVFLKPIRREKTYCETKEVKRLGITARDISRYEMLELKRESQEGVVITGVRPGGPAGEAKPALAENDVITEIEGVPIRNMEDLNKCLEAIKGDASVMVRFDRGKEKMLTVVHLKEEKEMEKIPYAKKGWLPVEVQSLTDDIRDKLKIKKRGVLVTRVYTKEENFPLKVGDIITEIEGESLPIRSPADKTVFYEKLTDYQVGSEIELTIIRDGQEIKQKVLVSAEPPSREEAAKYREVNLGISVREVCFEDVKELGEGKKGVIVDTVEEGSWASLAQLGVGDLILEINGEKVDNVDKFKEMIDKARAEKNDLVFYIERDTEHKFIEIKKLVWEARK
ncbi:PDZ domain-containing protein [bacterium]|nr:PDZ domain-containing protein [bacterium]